MGENEKAVQNCADTMKRQLTFKEYEIKDWAVNCINIAEYFVKNGHLAQAEYCLLSGFAILPEDNTRKKKLRATLQMQLGRYYMERMAIQAALFRESQTLDQDKALKKFVEFPELSVKFPSKVDDFKSIEDAKTLFRLANTQFKRSLDYFVLDGYVTEHIQMKQDVSKLYKLLSSLESDKDRFIAMQERRRELLEPITKDINPKAYEV
jgi:KIF-binding protein